MGACVAAYSKSKFWIDTATGLANKQGHLPISSAN